MTEYNIFRWYRAGWGRYTQADPLGLDPDVNLYRYTHGNPIMQIDLLGLDVRVCCRPLDTTNRVVSGYDHCYIESNSNGRRETWGLHFNPRDGKGEPRKNDKSDKGGRCTEWRPDPCLQKTNCFTREANKYPYERYSKWQANKGYFGFPKERGFRNSNTFARCISQRCGVGSVDDTVKGFAPGWDQDCPAW